MKQLVRFSVLLVCIALGFASAAARTPLRIDVSPALDRRDHLCADRENWQIAPNSDAVFNSHDIRFLLRPIGKQNPTLAANWWKAGLIHDAAMASDGAYVEGDDAGLSITISGLSNGRHSLVTFHNSIWDEALSTVDILINGKSIASDIKPSTKVTNDADAASAFAEFSVASGEDVVVEIRPHSLVPSTADEKQALHRVILNGLELDTVNPAKKSVKPVPAHGDEHVPEHPKLTWQSSKSTVAHDVYVGTNEAAVAAATHSSPEYRGRQKESQFTSDAADNFATYYWRVDEVHEHGDGPPTQESITPGDIWRFRVRHLAFPGAEGYGRFAVGGRGGRVIRVTNLNDSGPGSLRAAIEVEEPRTVVFDVSGRIVLQDRLIVRNPYLTIAGQTAPGNGICISNYNLGLLGTHDVIVRYIRVRPGDTAGKTLDGMGMASSGDSIFDHCSISWTQDESFSSRAAKNITLQRTLISEALNVAGHKKYEPGKSHGFAASIGGDIGSFHHNLLAHCAGRNWSLAGGLDKAGRHTGRLDIRNNVVYNWDHRTTDGGAQQVNFVNNYYKPGPATHVFHVLKPERNHSFGPQDYYVAGNVMEGRYDASQPLTGVLEPRNERLKDFVYDAPFFESFVTTQSAADALENVLADVGCNIPTLDKHDRRVIEEAREGTTTYAGSISGKPGLPDSQADVGGWDDYPEEHRPASWDTDGDGLPDVWEREHGFDPADSADGARDANGDGYTNLEEYLNGIRPTTASN